MPMTPDDKHRSPPPPVIALMGLPGAGKSTVARFLVEALQLREVNRDAIRAAMFPRCRYSGAEKHAANRAMMHAVEANCRQGIASVVDGMTFARRAEVETLRTRVADRGFALLPLLLRCPVEVAVARVAADSVDGSHPAADRDAELVRRVALRFEQPPPDVVRIDADRPVHIVSADVLAAVHRSMGLRD